MKRDIKSFDHYIAELFEKRGYPGMAVAIGGPEGILLQKGYGYRDGAQSLPVDENTVFGVASMSKSMTALACTILYVEGRLDLEAPISDYFPDLHIPGIPDECVTVRNLLMHRAGFPPLGTLEWSIVMNSKEPDNRWSRYVRETAPNRMNRIEQVAAYLSGGNYDPLGMPGEYMSYSNEGYALLSYVVDMAAGIPLEQFLAERIFEPLGMKRTVMDADGSRAKKLAGDNITSLFDRNDEGVRYCNDDWSVIPPFRGSACVKSTAADMCRYYRMLSNRGVYEGRQIVPKEAVELMIGEEFPLTDTPFYCLGLEKRKIEGKMICEHAGGLHGISGRGGILEGGYGAVVLCNEGELDMQEFLWACWNFILGISYEKMHHWAVPSGNPVQMPELYAGNYVSHEGLPVSCIVRVEDGRLSGTYDGIPVRFLHCQKSVFVAVDSRHPEKRVVVVEFYFRNGKTWGVRCGTRIFQRIKDDN